MVGRYEDVLHVLDDTETFSNLAPENLRYRDPRLIPTITDNDPPDATRYRKAAYRFFTPGQLRSYRPVFASISNELIDGFIDRGEAEWVSEFANQLPLMVLTDLLGLPRPMMPQLRLWVEQFHLHNAASDFGKKDGVGELRERHAEMHDFLLEEIDKRRTDPK